MKEDCNTIILSLHISYNLKDNDYFCIILYEYYIMAYDIFIISGSVGFRFDSDSNRVRLIGSSFGSVGLKTNPNQIQSVFKNENQTHNHTINIGFSKNHSDRFGQISVGLENFAIPTKERGFRF